MGDSTGRSLVCGRCAAKLTLFILFIAMMTDFDYRVVAVCLSETALERGLFLEGYRSRVSVCFSAGPSSFLP